MAFYNFRPGELHLKYVIHSDGKKYFTKKHLVYKNNITDINMGKEKNPQTDTPRHSLPNNPSFVIHTVEGTELKPAESVGKDEPICAPLVDLPPPPDGGWGWVIVFASFMCNLILGEYLSFQFLHVFCCLF